MHAAGSRHMFWDAPGHPLLSNGPLRAVPMRLSGRAFLRGAVFMGQGAQNRLDALPISAIVGRVQISPLVQAYNDAVRNQPHGRFDPPDPALVGTPPHFPPLTAAQQQTLLQIAQNPTADELKDLAVIDEFFSYDFSSHPPGAGPGGVQGRGTFLTTLDVCNGLRNPPRTVGYFNIRPQAGDGLTHWLTYVPPATRGWGAPQTGVGGWARVAEILDNKFYCPPPANLPVPAEDDHAYTNWFKVDPQGTWGAARIHVDNAITMMDQLNSFPYPPPIDIDSRVFRWQPEVRNYLMMISGYDVAVDPESFRSWITIAILSTFDSMVTAIEADLKRANKRARRKMLMKAIGLAIASIVAAWALPGIIAAAISLIKTAVQTYIDIQKRKEAAKQMADAAKMFEADAPAFAAEVQKTADMLDFAAAQAAADQPLTPDQQTAVQEVKSDMAPPTSALVVGGVAAAGIVALLLIFVK